MLALFLVAACGLMFFQACYDHLNELREAGAGGWDFWSYIFVTMLNFLAIVLPIALLLSLLGTLTKMHRANELTAMRAAGVGFVRLTAPIWCVGVLACGLAWVLGSVVVPWSVERSRTQLEDLQYRQQAKAMPPDHVGAVFDVAFDNATDRRLWFFNRYSKFTDRGYGVSVSELDAQRREMTRLVAAQAWYDPARSGWVFQGGRELRFDPDSGEQMTSEPFARKFEPQFHENPQLMLLITARPIDLSFFELRSLIAYFAVANKARGVSYAVRYFGLIADTLQPLIVIAIAIPFAVTGVRVNPAVGVSKAIGLFLLYYALSQVAAVLATKQIIAPEFAAWLPNLGLTGFAAWLFFRMR